MEKKVQELLDLAKTDEAQRSYIFNQVPEKATDDMILPVLNGFVGEGYFDPQKLSRDSSLFLWKISERNNKKQDFGITNVLASLIREYITFQSNPKTRKNDLYLDYNMIRIMSNLPIENLDMGDIRYINIALNGLQDTSLIESHIVDNFFPVLLKNNANEFSLELLRILLCYYRGGKSRHDAYFFGQLLKKNKKKLLELWPLDVVNLLSEEIKKPVEDDRRFFVYLSLPSSSERFESYVLELFHDALLKIPDSGTLKRLLEDMLKADEPVFKMLAIRVIGEKFEEFRDLYFGLVENPLDDIRLHHENYKLIKNNAKKLSGEEIKKVIEWIEGKEYHVTGLKEEDKNKSIAYRKKEWYSALLDSGNDTVKENYGRYEKINPEKLDHPGQLYWMEASYGLEESGEFNEILIRGGTEDAANFLNGQPRVENNSMEFTMLSLHDSLRRAVSKDPLKFSDDIFPFETVSYIYIDGIISGFSMACRENRTFSWKNVLDFILVIIKKEAFFDNEDTADHKSWVKLSIARLIMDGTFGETHFLFESDQITKVKDILLLLGSKNSSESSSYENITTALLNTVDGEVYSALLELSKKIAIENKKEGEGYKWDNEIKDFFTAKLTELSELLVAAIGEYFPLLCSLDRKWVESNIDVIFPSDNDKLWKSAMEGYLFANGVNTWAYDMLKSHGDYEKAIDYEFKQRIIQDNLIRHVCVTYLNGPEDLETGLIGKVLNMKKLDQLDEIVRFIWSLRREPNDSKFEDKIILLWDNMYKRYKQSDDEMLKNVLFRMVCLWLGVVDEIYDNVYKLAKDSMRYGGKERDTHILFDNFQKHLQKTPKKVGEIFLELLNSNVYPYEKEKAPKIVRELSRLGEIDIAKKICVSYLSNGFFFMKDVYNEIEGVSK